MTVQTLVRKALKPFKSWLTGDSRVLLAHNQQLLGRMASWQVRARTRLPTLQAAEFKVTSQWGQDGIIDWLIERADVPPAARSFIEFGVETYREANTRFLMQNRNWRGLIMDGSPQMLAALREDGVDWAHDITARPVFITRENINDLISEAGFSGEIGLLNIDLDGNDYWIWEAIHVVRPIIVVCEYNAVFGDLLPIAVPYKADFNRPQAHHSNLYFGASVAALRLLAARKGYRFVGTTSAANDAFFVREDYAERFVDAALERVVALPSMARESRDEQGRLNFISGLDRIRHIAALPVVDVETSQQRPIGELGPVYSAEWTQIMAGAHAD